MHGTVKISYMKDLVSADTRARPEITSNGGGGTWWWWGLYFLEQILNPLLIKSIGIQLTGINF